MLKDTIYTIPINDVFEPKCGCPICLMKDMLERRCVEYIMGAAMMEPDVREETNKHGFCGDHFEMLMTMKNRLALALMLETHIDELRCNELPFSPKKSGKPQTQRLPSERCFVCSEIEGAMQKMLDTVLHLYFGGNAVFKKTFLEQEYYCFPHYEMLCKAAADALPKKQAAVFIDDLTDKMRTDMQSLRDDVHAFCVMFDYRSDGGKSADERVKGSIERAVMFLTGK